MKFTFMKYNKSIFLGFIALLMFGSSSVTKAQYNNKWMSVGSLQDWYSEIGCEVEEGFVKEQQYGLQWPAIYNHQDNKAARGLWIGSTNFTDEKGVTYPYKVVHVGPRVPGTGEFFPQEFKLISKFDPPTVYVDGIPSFAKPVDNDEIDPTMKPDRMIYNVVNTQLGLTMTRKIMQFGQQYNDNYIIYDFSFTNTGNVNGDSKIELPNNTLSNIYIYWQYRNAITAETRYEIGNGTGWGMNTMNDARGDGVKVDPPGEQFRAQYSWHGKFPPFTGGYDNIGGPIWVVTTNIAKGDTVGRLGAIQFVGVVTLHADKSAADTTDDVNQPSTTNYISSDDSYESNNDAYNPTKMEFEYKVMSSGHESPRHADKVQPDGKFDDPTGDPALGTTGGYSFANGYGPYTLKPGESIHIVMAEAAAGLDRETATRVGIKYKKGLIDAVAKNDSVLTGKDSLFQTFNRAIANYNSGYNIPEPPKPPKSFTVTSGGDKISLDWDVYNTDPNLKEFRIYRATGQYDSTYHLIHTSLPSERNFDDKNPIRGLSYFYYIVSVGNNGLRSSRYYTQTFDPATLKRPSGESPYSASLKGTKNGPFFIQAGVNNRLKIKLDTLQSKVVYLKADSTAIDTLSLNNIIADINTAFNKNVASSDGLGKLVITSLSTGPDSKVEIQSVDTSAYSVLGLSTGTVFGGVPTAAEAMDKIRVVPNPFNISADKSLTFGQQQPNRLAFFNIPGQCTIRIYTEIGELVKTITHTDGSGDAYWDSVTSSNQLVVSGIYIAVIDNTANGERKIVKFVIIR